MGYPVLPNDDSIVLFLEKGILARYPLAPDFEVYCLLEFYFSAAAVIYRRWVQQVAHSFLALSAIVYY